MYIALRLTRYSMYRCIVYVSDTETRKIYRDPRPYADVRPTITTIHRIGLEVARVESSELNLGGVADITTSEYKDI